MRKSIEIEQVALEKLKILSALNNTSVEELLQKAVQSYVKEYDTRFKMMSEAEKEDLGLWLLMQEGDRNDTVSEEEIFKILKQKK